MQNNHGNSMYFQVQILFSTSELAFSHRWLSCSGWVAKNTALILLKKKKKSKSLLFGLPDVSILLLLLSCSNIFAWTCQLLNSFLELFSHCTGLPKSSVFPLLIRRPILFISEHIYGALQLIQPFYPLHLTYFIRVMLYGVAIGTIFTRDMS